MEQACAHLGASPRLWVSETRVLPDRHTVRLSHSVASLFIVLSHLKRSGTCVEFVVRFSGRQSVGARLWIQGRAGQ